MKFWFISDTHTKHGELSVPEADAVIHCGDEAMNIRPKLNETESREFFDWFSQLAIPHKIFIPGNHSTAIEGGLVCPEDYPSVTFLIHSATTCGTWNVFGSPYTPRYHDWAYMKKRSQLDPIWQTIPDDTDILVTHGPPKGILDLTRDRDEDQLVQAGCGALRRQVEERIKPRIHAFGHIHDERGINCYGIYTRGETQFVNCACCNLRGELVHPGFVLTVE